ncbi:MAG: plasmid stability protein [Gammaproteobacteria bacterium]|nr:plasmid stability protein [Gammaproteobacteria bacterium]
MRTITIRDVPEAVYERWKALARRRRRSLRTEVIDCLTRHVERSVWSRDESIAKAAELRARLRWVDHALVDRYKRAGRA